MWDLSAFMQSVKQRFSSWYNSREGRDGFLWSAGYHGWRITRYAPDGRVDRVIEMPMQCPTSCAFGGPNLDRLYITTARPANDDPAQILTGAAPRLFYDRGASQWKLVIEATMFVTYAVVNVWTGIKHGGTDPTGVYTRITGCDPVAALAIESA